MLGPNLFIMVMHDIVRELHDKVERVKIGYRKVQMIKLAEFAFADNRMIFAENEDKLHQNIEWWEKELTKHKMLINTNKTKAVVIGKEDKWINIKINRTSQKL